MTWTAAMPTSALRNLEKSCGVISLLHGYEAFPYASHRVGKTATECPGQV